MDGLQVRVISMLMCPFIHEIKNKQEQNTFSLLVPLNSIMHNIIRKHYVQLCSISLIKFIINIYNI